MTKGWIKFLKSLKDLRYQYFPPSNSSLSASETGESTTKLASEEPDALTLVSILGIFLIPLILRFGSRFTLAELVGLNFLDEKLIAQLNSFITFFQSLGQEKFLLLFAGWFLAKLTCIDYLSIILAIGSGILLENVWIATITSILCSTIASFLLFTAARLYLGEDVQKDIAKRPIIRALDRSLKQNGFKTVFSLRISPVIPIPIAAYNYMYALSSVSALDFIAGVGLGSVKPYLLDSYLGSFLGTSLLSGEGNLNMKANEWMTFGVIAVILLVGTFASQLVSSTWKEIQEELKSIQKQQKEDKDGVEVGSGNGFDVFSALGIEQKDIPSPLIQGQEKLKKAWDRLKVVIEDEGKEALFNSTSIVKKEEDKSKGKNSIVTKFSYENDELNVENMLDYTIESSIFTFALWSIGNELMASYTPNTIIAVLALRIFLTPKKQQTVTQNNVNTATIPSLERKKTASAWGSKNATPVISPTIVSEKKALNL
eukprot:gene1898-2031_t